MPNLTIIYRPAAMIWPLQFSNTSLLYALHDRSRSDPSQTDGWLVSRYRYFIYVAVGSFVWYWYVQIRANSLLTGRQLTLAGSLVFCGRASQSSASSPVSLRSGYSIGLTSQSTN
jgi:hypothetical protein